MQIDEHWLRVRNACLDGQGWFQKEFGKYIEATDRGPTVEDVTCALSEAITNAFDPEWQNAEGARVLGYLEWLADRLADDLVKAKADIAALQAELAQFTEGGE